MRSNVLKISLLFLTYTILLTSIYGQEKVSNPFKLDIHQEEYDLVSHTQFVLDPEGVLSIEDLKTDKLQSQFAPLDINKPRYSGSKVYWTKIELQNQIVNPLFTKDWLLALNPHNPHIEAYVFQADSLVNVLYAGQHMPFSKRSYKALAQMSRSCIPLHLETGKKVEVYLKFIEERERAVNLQIKLIDQKFLDHKIIESLLISTFILGGLILMIIILLVLNWYTWQPEYSCYLLYLLSLLFIELFTTSIDTHYISSQVGITSYFLEPTWWANTPQYRALIDTRWYLTILAYILFIKSFLNLKKLLPFWNRMMNIMLLLGVSIMLYTLYILINSGYNLFLYEDTIGKYILLYYLVTIVFLFPLYKTKDARAIFVIVAFVVIIIGSTPTLYGILFEDASSGYDDVFLIFALFVEKIIFTLALSFRQRKTEEKLHQREVEKNQILERQFLKLEKANERVIAAARVKKDFLGLVSHELRTPMNGVVGFTELLKHYPSSADQDFCIENLDISNKIMLRMIDNLLALLELDEEDITLQKEVFNIHEFLDVLISAHQKTSKNKEVGIYLDANPKIPALLLSDSKRLKLILDNLLDNAIKYTKKGSVILEIAILEQNAMQVKLHFKITDTGIGIAKERQSRIFELFSEASKKSNRNYDGLGIGLPLSKRLLALLGSEIKLYSEIGKGSCFEFEVVFEISSNVA